MRFTARGLHHQPLQGNQFDDFVRVREPPAEKVCHEVVRHRTDPMVH
jgi:hypothetical protein